MAVSVRDVARDLAVEQAVLAHEVSSLNDDDWMRPTASDRWTIADQIGHLAFFDDTAALAITDPDGFAAHMAELLTHFSDAEAVDNATLGRYRQMSPRELLDDWNATAQRLSDAAEHLDDDTRVAWYGPSMGAKSFLTARLMECWAHGQDVLDAAGIDRMASDRIEHIVRLGVITRGWSYMNRGLEIPEAEVFVQLESPSGSTWEFGDPAAAQSLRGSAEDFCLVVTQRRHVDSTGLVTTGDDARDWMLKAQVFAGPPTSGPDAPA